MEYSQAVRHRILVPTSKGSNPFTPDYICDWKNKLLNISLQSLVILSQLNSIGRVLVL
jgi:hypothetical protein